MKGVIDREVKAKEESYKLVRDEPGESGILRMSFPQTPWQDSY